MHKRPNDMHALDLKIRTVEALRIADHELIRALEREIDELRARVNALEGKHD